MKDLLNDAFHSQIIIDGDLCASNSNGSQFFFSFVVADALTKKKPFIFRQIQDVADDEQTKGKKSRKREKIKMNENGLFSLMR